MDARSTATRAIASGSVGRSPSSTAVDSVARPWPAIASASTSPASMRSPPPAARASRSASGWSRRPSASSARRSSGSGSPGRPDSSCHVAMRSRSKRSRWATAPTRSCSTARRRRRDSPAASTSPYKRVDDLQDLDPAGIDHLDEAARLELLHVVRVQEQLGCGQRHLLAHGHDLEGRPVGGRQQAQPLVHQVAQPGLRPAAGEHHRGVGPERPALLGGRHQLADEQHVAPAELPDAVEQRRRHPVAQHRHHQLLGGRLRQRADVDALDQLVLPQRHEPVGHRPPGAGAHHDPDRRLRDRQVHEGDRHGVEQVGVVDRQHERPLAPRPGVQAGQRQVQQVVGVVGLVGGVEHVGERPERDVARRLGGPHPLDRRAPGLQGGDRVGDEARLPDARLPEQDRPAGPAVQGKQAADRLQLCVSSHEWPRCDHRPRAYCGEIRMTYGSATTGDAVGSRLAARGNGPPRTERRG